MEALALATRGYLGGGPLGMATMGFVSGYSGEESGYSYGSTRRGISERVHPSVIARIDTHDMMDIAHILIMSGVLDEI